MEAAIEILNAISSALHSAVKLFASAASSIPFSSLQSDVWEEMTPAVIRLTTATVPGGQRSEVIGLRFI